MYLRVVGSVTYLHNLFGENDNCDCGDGVCMSLDVQVLLDFLLHRCQPMIGIKFVLSTAKFLLRSYRIGSGFNLLRMDNHSY